MRLLLISLFFSSISLYGQNNSTLLDEFSLKAPEVREQILRNYREIIRRGLGELKEADPYVDPYNYTALSTLVAYAYSAQGNRDSTRYWLQWIDDPAFKEIQYPARMIGLYVRTGIHQRTKIGIDGLKDLIAAQQIAERYNDDFNQSLAQGYRGVALLARGLDRDGVSLLRASIESLEKYGYLKYVRNSQANLAAFYIRAGLYHKALEILHQLISLPEGEMTNEFQSLSASNAALSYIRLGMMEEADSMISKGLSISEDAGFQFGILYALNLRINYFIELAEWDQVKLVLDDLSIRDSANFIKNVQDLRAYNALLVGRYYEHQKEYDSAKLLYQEAIRFSTPGSKFPDFGEAFEGLHRVSITAGDLGEAQRVFSELNRIRDSLLADKMQIGLELYESEKLLETQSAQLEEQQQELEVQNLNRQRLIVALVGITLLFIILFLAYRNKEIIRARELSEESNMKLSAYTRELEELAFVVSHNLRESARNISTYTGLFSREAGDKLSEKGKTYLDFMYRASWRTSEMLGDLETYVGIGNHLPERKPVNLNQVWDKAFNSKKAAVGQVNIHVKKDTLPVIKGHTATLELLFAELLDNSIKYRKGDALELTISCRRDSDCQYINFTDNGIGFSEVYKEKIFRVFQRLHSNEEIPGTGIGLPIIDKVVRLYGGTVDVNSQEGKGATFILKFPAFSIVG